MRISPPLALALLAGLCACNADSPRSIAPAPRARVESVPTQAPARSRPIPQLMADSRPEPDPELELDPASVLDDEERWLLEADDATLTREERVARAYARKKLVMADPGHPMRPVMETLEERVASGEYAEMAHAMMFGGGAVPAQDEPEASAQSLAF